MTKTQTQKNDVMKEALEWFVRSEARELNGAEKQAFDQWLKADGAHGRAYLAVMDHEEQTASVMQTADFHEMGAEIYHSSKRPTAARLRFLVPIAAAVVLLLGLVQMLISPTHFYQTAVGEQRDISLADGSVIKLNTDTAVSVDFSAEARHVTIHHGQAAFSVAGNAEAPFVVDYGAGEVMVLGTVFDVFKRPQDTRVTLLEGKVRVGGLVDIVELSVPPEGVSGQPQQVLHGGNGLSDIRQVSREEVTAWQDQMMVFNAWPLSDVVAEVNRYSGTKIVIADEGVNSFQLSGSFLTTDTDMLLQAMEAYFPVQVAENKNGEKVIVLKQ